MAGGTEGVSAGTWTDEASRLFLSLATATFGSRGAAPAVGGLSDCPFPDPIPSLASPSLASFGGALVDRWGGVVGLWRAVDVGVGTGEDVVGEAEAPAAGCGPGADLMILGGSLAVVHTLGCDVCSQGGLTRVDGVVVVARTG